MGGLSTSARLAAVVVHYGDPAPTLRCLDSLAGIDEVILVDQAPRLAGAHPSVTTRIEPGTNLGFAEGCNRGVAAATAPFVLLLNNDAVLEPGAVDALHADLSSLAPDVAGACLKILCMDGATLQSAGGLWFTRDGIGYPVGFGEPDRGQYDALPDERVGVPSGAAAVYRTDAWREADGMCADFFCYCEDGDIGLRMIAAGWRFAWLPQVKARHEMSANAGAHSAFKAYQVERNHFASMVHTAPFASLAMLPPRTLVRVARAGLDALRGRGAGASLARESSPAALVLTLLRAWMHAFRMMPAALEVRRSLRLRHRGGQARVARFLASRGVSLGAFAKARSLPGSGRRKTVAPPSTAG